MKEVTLANILITPDGTEMQSLFTHDFQTYIDKNGKEYMIDGGIEYIHRSAHGDEVVKQITTKSPFEEIRKYLMWGTRGKDGNQPLVMKAMKDLDTDHIKAILKTQTHISEMRRKYFKKELLYRKKL